MFTKNYFVFSQIWPTTIAIWLFGFVQGSVLLAQSDGRSTRNVAISGALPSIRPLPAGANYKISSDDILEIAVFQESDLRSIVRVSTEGTITLPLIKGVQIKGLTTQEAAFAIQERLAKGYLINPQVSITVMEFSKRRFTVLGQVQRPGAYDMPDRQEISLPQAIAIAGGFTRLADVRKVTLTRNEDKGPQVFVLNAHDMESGKDKSQFIIRPNDLISVEESNF